MDENRGLKSYEMEGLHANRNADGPWHPGGADARLLYKAQLDSALFKVSQPGMDMVVVFDSLLTPPRPWRV